MTGSIHFIPWPKPTRLGQFWLFHAPSFPQARRFGYPLDIQTDPLAHTCPPSTIRFSNQRTPEEYVTKRRPGGSELFTARTREDCRKETIALISCEVILLSSPLWRKQEKRATGQRTNSRVGERAYVLLSGRPFCWRGNVISFPRSSPAACHSHPHWQRMESHNRGFLEVPCTRHMISSTSLFTHLYCADWSKTVSP
jgi:hypothetical protein